MKKIILAVVLTTLFTSAVFGIAIYRMQAEHFAGLEELRTTYENKFVELETTYENKFVDLKDQVSNYVIGEGVDMLYNEIDGTLNIVQKAKNRIEFEKEFKNTLNNY